MDHGGVAEDRGGGFERGVALAEDEDALAGVGGGVGVHVLVAGGVFDAADVGDVGSAPAGGDDEAVAVQDAVGGVDEEAVVEAFDPVGGGVEAYGELVVALEVGEVAHHVVGVGKYSLLYLAKGRSAGSCSSEFQSQRRRISGSVLVVWTLLREMSRRWRGKWRKNSAGAGARSRVT